MRAYFSTQPLYNLLSPPITSRFTVALSALSASSGAPSDEGHRNPKPPINRDAGCYLFDSYLTYPLPACKDDLKPKGLRNQLLQTRHPSVTPRTAAA